MSASNQVTRVVLIFELANGDLHRLAVTNPAPAGGNPIFLWQQVQTALDELGRRANDSLHAYGQQVERTP